MFYIMFKYSINVISLNTYFKINYFANYNTKLTKFMNLNKFFYFNNLLNDFIIFYMKKEFLYTKLKYSRVPQFDISAGAAAGLLAGLLGFIVTEKFGFELLDSGDFYTLVMYVIFIILVLRIVVRCFNYEHENLNLSTVIYYFINFYLICFNLIINFIKNSIVKLRVWLKKRVK